MASLLSKVYPTKQDLTRRFDAILAKMDKGHLTPGRANRALSDTLCERVIQAMDAQGPECFSVWFHRGETTLSTLAGWGDPGLDLTPLSTVEEGNGPRHRVVRTGRPALVNDQEAVNTLAGEILEGEHPDRWQAALITPVEKAGNGLGLAIALFTRPLAGSDLEATLRLCDQLASALVTNADGQPELL